MDMTSDEFISGRKLSHLRYDEQVASILKRRFPNLKYGAGFFGSRSDVLEYDTFRSSEQIERQDVGLVCKLMWVFKTKN